jgi:DNA-binding SARP family transcriptional activator/Flp pilus assembly protein TadD
MAGRGLRIQILGPVRAWRDDRSVELGETGQRAVLGLLALAGGHPVSRAELVDALWGERSPTTVANVIQTYVKHLRRLLEPDRQPRTPSVVLPAMGDGYALRVPADRLDVACFRRWVAGAAAARQSGDMQRAAALLDRALQLWDGPPLADVPVLSAHPKTIALVRERRGALLQYADALIAVGAAGDAIPVLEELAGADPLDEAAKARLIRAYHATGQRARAFTLYRETRRQVADELGLDPGPELAAAHTALLSGDTLPAAAAEPADGRGQPRPAQLPADVRGFTGRASELSTLDRLLRTGPADRPGRDGPADRPGWADRPVQAGRDGPADRDDRSDETAADPAALVVCVISGTAGVGKTALAVRWAHRARKHFPDGQLYLNLRGYDPDQPMPPGEALDRFLAAIGVTGQDTSLDPDDRAARYRTEIADRRMLIVLDNAASVEQIRPLLPGTSSCVVLVTSRDSLAGLVALHGARRLELDPLPLADAVTLLERLIGPRVPAEPPTAAALAGQCARLPLALRVAAELVTSRPAAPLSDVVAELADQQRRLDLLDAGDDARAAVRTVFHWSYQHLPAEPARAFRLLGAHPGADFDGYAVAALVGTDLTSARRLIDLLARAHLIQSTGAGRFGMHDLLRGYASQLAQADDAGMPLRLALTRLFDYYRAAAAAAMDCMHPADRHHRPPVAVPDTPVPPLAEPATARAWLDTHRPTLVEACGYGATRGWPGHSVDLAATLYRYLEGGYYTDALTIHRHALHAARETGDQAGEAHALTDLGAIDRLLGRYGTAGDHLRQAVTGYQQTNDRLGEARALSNLGIVEERLGQYESAIEHHQRALTLYRQGGDRHGEASTLNNLGAVYPERGNYESAKERYHQALACYRTLGDRAGEAIVLSNIGTVDVQLGLHPSATGHFQRALTIFRELGHRYGEAAVLNNLGDVETQIGRIDPAIERQQQALAIFRELGHRYGEASVLNSLGEALRSSSRPYDARVHHEAALTIAADTGDRDEQARAHDGLAQTYQATDDLAEARQHWQQALKRYTEAGSPAATPIRAHLTRLDRASGRPQR